MRGRCLLACVALMAAPVAVPAQIVEKVRAGTPGAPGLPEDLFDLPPGQWVFAKQLWAGSDPCTADQCEAGYTSGDLAVSVERSKEAARIVLGFRNCPNVAWNELEIGSKPSKSDTRLIAKRLKKVLATSAKFCKLTAPTLPPLDATWLFPATAEGQ